MKRFMKWMRSFKVVEWCERFIEECRMDAYYEERPFWPIFFYSLWSVGACQSYGRIACHYFGHGKHFVDTGYGGPESGVDSGHCDRCGWSHHTTLY